MVSNNYNKLLVFNINGIYQWEHVSAAQSWGQSFKEWREGDPKCVTKNR